MRDEVEKERAPDSSLIPHPSSLGYPSSLGHPSSFIPHPLVTPSFLYALTAGLTVAFVSLIVIAPLASSHRHDFTALVIYKSFEKFCHQIPERSFYIDGHPLAVCARCTGIYFGFAAAVLIYPFVRSLKLSYPPLARKWLFVALAPALLDFALDFFGIWTNTRFTRAVTGALLGSVTALYVVPALLDMARLRSGRWASE